MLPGVFKCDLRMQSDNDKSGYSLLHFSDLNYLFSFKQTHKKMFSRTLYVFHAHCLLHHCVLNAHWSPCILCTHANTYHIHSASSSSSSSNFYSLPLFASTKTIRYIWKMFHNFPYKCLKCNLIQMVLTHLCYDITTFMRMELPFGYFHLYMFGSMRVGLAKTSRI